MICTVCRKEKPVVFELEAAAPSKDRDLQKKLEAEERGHAAGPLHLCAKCMLEGYAYRKKEAA
jgi:hypothetical protein